MIFHPSVLWFTFITEHVKNKAEQQEQRNHTKGFSPSKQSGDFRYSSPTAKEFTRFLTRTNGAGRRAKIYCI